MHTDAAEVRSALYPRKSSKQDGKEASWERAWMSQEVSKWLVNGL